MFNLQFLFLVCVVLSGCGEEGVDDTYGRRSGAGASSVNGTAVLGEMFESAGHKVSSWRMLSPRLREKADCIVWFPDDFEPPDRDTRRWFEEWLDGGFDRTLIYVGRDFDAAIGYWEKVLPNAPPEQKGAIREQRDLAEAYFAMRRAALPRRADCRWFVVDGTAEPRRVRTLEGDPDWCDGVNAGDVEIELNSRIKPSLTAETLLASDEDVLVSRLWRGDGQVIVVANGSFLLNLSLVNHEHRKLADSLVAEIGSRPQHVYFLESGPGGPPISDKDPAMGTPTGLAIFTISPANWILFHLAAVGILLCFARWPIFGRARGLKPDAPSDFGKHVQALGELLSLSRDRAYAAGRLLHYRQTVAGREE